MRSISVRLRGFGRGFLVAEATSSSAVSHRNSLVGRRSSIRRLSIGRLPIRRFVGPSVRRNSPSVVGSSVVDAKWPPRSTAAAPNRYQRPQQRRQAHRTSPKRRHPRRLNGPEHCRAIERGNRLRHRARRDAEVPMANALPVGPATPPRCSEPDWTESTKWTESREVYGVRRSRSDLARGETRSSRLGWPGPAARRQRWRPDEQGRRTPRRPRKRRAAERREYRARAILPPAPGAEAGGRAAGRGEDPMLPDLRRLYRTFAVDQAVLGGKQAKRGALGQCGPEDCAPHARA